MSSAVHATQLDINTIGLVLPNGLRVAKVAVKMPTPVVQISPVFVPEGTIVDLDATVEAADIQSYLNTKQPSGMTNFSVKAEDGLLTVTAIAKIILPVQVGGQGRLDFSNGRLNFIPLRAEVGGVKMPDGMMREQLNKVNPIIDITGVPIDAKVKSIEVSNGLIRISASLVVTAPIPRREP